MSKLLGCVGLAAVLVYFNPYLSHVQLQTALCIVNVVKLGIKEGLMMFFRQMPQCFKNCMEILSKNNSDCRLYCGDAILAFAFLMPNHS